MCDFDLLFVMNQEHSDREKKKLRNSNDATSHIKLNKLKPTLCLNLFVIIFHTTVVT